MPTTTEVPAPDQPISRVVWMPRERLRANDYNPNHVAPPELRLLKLSIIENGWTQPIVARPAEVLPDGSDHEIVDGFHRWTVAAHDEIHVLTGGLVPVVVITPDPATQRMATIRHNRARGTHAVIRMADIVIALSKDMGLTPEEIGDRLQMEPEEIKRLILRGDMRVRGRGEGGFSKGWVAGDAPAEWSEGEEAEDG